MRVSVRKLFSFLGGTAGVFIIVLNLHLQIVGHLPLTNSYTTLTAGLETTPTIDRQPGEVPTSQVKKKEARIPTPEERPWYMRHGKVRPRSCEVDVDTGVRNATIYPEEAWADRMINQLMFVPPADDLPDQEDVDAPLKKILLWNGGSAWGGTRPGRGIFLKRKCPVSTCVISTSRKDSGSADLVIFKDHFVMPGFDRPKGQLWMMYMLECPLNTQHFKHPSVFNWTATYRSDSTVVTPYERWEYYNPLVTGIPQPINYAANKTKKVAWFVSNCGARNGRLDYAKKLSQHIEVDIYGTCGDKTCPRSNRDCFHLLDTDYKFYLSFENSNCVDYITEKFYVNGLSHNVLPIVMGARPEDYRRSAPHKSFIHVDDFESPAALARYLHVLDNNDDLYNEYFKWKGTGEMIDTKFFCRLCSLLHDKKDRGKYGAYGNINSWWRERVCINGSWRDLHKPSNKKKAAHKTVP